MKRQNLRLVVIGVAATAALVTGVTVAMGDPNPATVTQQQALDANAIVQQFIQQHPDVSPTPSITLSATPSATPSVPVTVSPSATPSPSVSVTTPPATCAWPTCFPSAATVGPSGTLTPVSGDLTVSSGTVNSKNVSGVIRITGGTATNPVVITNSVAAGIIGCASCRWTLTDSRVDANNTDSTGQGEAIQGGSFTILRTEITRAFDGIRLDGSNNPSVVRDSLIHNLWHCPDCHNDGVQFYDPGVGKNITFDHNTIDANVTNGDLANSALMLADNPKNLKVTMTHNRFSNGGYSVRLYDGKAGSGDVYTFTENTVVKNSYQYGPCLLTYTPPFDGTSGYKWSGNVYSDGTPWTTSDC